MDPYSLHRGERDVTIVALAGPIANLVVTFVAGLFLRLGLSGEAFRFVFAILYANVVLFVFNLMPIPGLDGSRILRRYLSTRAREVYANLDHYLVLFMLLIFFLLAAPLLSIVNALAGVVCNLAGGVNCG